jgi:hypothetical protein
LTLTLTPCGVVAHSEGTECGHTQRGGGLGTGLGD